MNLSKSPYIGLTIDIGHLFPKIVLFRYNRFWLWAQTHNVSFNFAARENRAVEVSDERRVVYGGPGRRKDISGLISLQIRGETSRFSIRK